MSPLAWHLHDLLSRSRECAYLGRPRMAAHYADEALAVASVLIAGGA